MTGTKVLETEERACANWNVPRVVWTLRGRQMFVVRKQNATDARASLPPLQLVERPADHALDGGGKGHWMESGQMPASAIIWAYLHGNMRSSGNGLAGSDWHWEGLAKTRGDAGTGGARAAGARAGLKVFGPEVVSCSSCQSFWSLFVSLCFFLSNHAHVIDFPMPQGTMGSRWRSASLAARPEADGGLWALSYSNQSEYRMNKTEQKDIVIMWNTMYRNPTSTASSFKVATTRDITQEMCVFDPQLRWIEGLGVK